MPRLLRPVPLLLPERRLVDQQVRPLRRIHHRRARPRVPGEHDGPPRTLGTDEALSCQLSAVSQLDRLSLTELAPQRAFGNARGARFLHVEPPAPLVLAQRVPYRPPSVLGLEHLNVILFPLPLSPALYRIPWLHLRHLNLERNAFHAEPQRLRQQLLRPLGTVQPQRLGARL